MGGRRGTGLTFTTELGAPCLASETWVYDGAILDGSFNDSYAATRLFGCAYQSGVPFLMSSVAKIVFRIRHRVGNTVGIVLVCLLLGMAIVTTLLLVEDRWGRDAFIRWGGLLGFTVGLFGLFLGESDRYLRERRFWMLTIALLTAHLVAFAIVLTHVEEWKLAWFTVMAIEYPGFLFLRGRFMSDH